jgi:hypothetical protein
VERAWSVEPIHKAKSKVVNWMYSFGMQNALAHGVFTVRHVRRYDKRIASGLLFEPRGEEDRNENETARKDELRKLFSSWL